MDFCVKIILLLYCSSCFGFSYCLDLPFADLCRSMYDVYFAIHVADMYPE